MPVPGDIAYVRILPEGETILESLAPREVSLTRRTVGGREKTMAANVDTLVTVTSLADPPPRTVVLDQLIAFTELQGITPVVVLTKPDLASPGVARHLQSIYSKLGYPVVLVDPKHGTNVEGLRALLAPRRSLLCGVSGVGKSSIFRALGGVGAIGGLSRRGLGRQTTTAARLCRIEGGFLIDSPGVAEFGLGAITPRDLASAFLEMSGPAERCRFRDCTHLHEPQCGVRAAVATGTIDPSRYSSYRQILGAA